MIAEGARLVLNSKVRLSRGGVIWWGCCCCKVGNRAGNLILHVGVIFLLISVFAAWWSGATFQLPLLSTCNPACSTSACVGSDGECGPVPGEFSVPGGTISRETGDGAALGRIGRWISFWWGCLVRGEPAGAWHLCPCFQENDGKQPHPSIWQKMLLVLLWK